MTTGQIIKKLRIEKKMTQKELADILGYSDLSSISKIEKGVKELPTNKLSAVAEIFGVSVDALLNNSTTNTSEKVTLINVASLYGDGAAELLGLYSKLNFDGQKKLIEVTKDYSEIEKYKKQ